MSFPTLDDLSKPISRMLSASVLWVVFSRWRSVGFCLAKSLVWLACAVTMAIAAAAEADNDKPGSNAVQVLAPLSLSGPLASTARDYLIGAQARFNSDGTAAGRGRAVNLVVTDNSSIEGAQEVLSKAFLENPSAIAVFMPMQIISALELLNSQQIALIAPPGGGFEEHDPSLSPNNFHIKGSCEVEFQKIAEHLATLNINKVAFVYDGILGSRESNSLPLVTQIFLGKQISIKPIYLEEGPGKNEAVLSEIRSYQPQAVILGLAGEDILRFLEAYRSQVDGWPLYTTSQGNQTSVRQALRKAGASLGITQVFPPFWDRTVPVVREYQDAMKRLGRTEFSYHSLEGYIAASVLANGIRNARLPLTRQGIVAALENLGRIDLGGFIVNFSPRSHAGANYIDLVLLRSDGQYIR